MFSFLLPSSLLFAEAMPRGPGFYFNLGKLAAVLAVYLGWVKLCWWVDQDARELKLKPRNWNLLMLGGGLLGLLCVWVVSLSLIHI